MNTGNETRTGDVVVIRPFLVMIFTWVLFLVGPSICFATTVTLKWDAVSDSTLSGYKVYYQADSSVQPFAGTGSTQGASPVDISNQTTATISGLDPAHSYYFAVTAYNTAGTETPYSNVFYVPELTAPTVSLTYPANNASVTGTISVTASASDNVGVAKVEYYVNGILAATDTSTPYVYSWNTSALASGTYTLMAMAYDAAGNIGQSSNVSVTVVNDTTPPAVSVTAPSNNATVSGTVTISTSASDNVGVSKVEFYENGVLLSASNVAPFTYKWDTTTVSNGTYTLSARAYDAAGNSATSSNVTIAVNNTVSDTTAPTVSAFTLPATATSLTVAVSSLTATDNVAVTGYLVTSSSTAPAASATGWSSTAPTSFTFSAAGSKTAYAWAKDAAGNVSAAKSASVTITLADTTAPTVSAFTLPASASSLTIAVSSFTATDNVAVTGYLITESSTAPSASAAGWSSAVPTSFTFSAAGSKTAYAWAKDAAGNVSAAKSASVTITLADTTAPTVSAFTLPASASSLTIAVSSFTATDNVAVTGYLITESSTAPSASATGWNSTVPTSFTFSATGSKTAYAWAKDAAGNVSAAKSAGTVITLASTTTNYTVSDALLALQVASGKVTPTSAQMTSLDVAPVVNGVSAPNGKIDSGDVIVILSKIVGKTIL